MLDILYVFCILCVDVLFKGTILHTGDAVVNKTDKICALLKLTLSRVNDSQYIPEKLF